MFVRSFLPALVLALAVPLAAVAQTAPAAPPAAAAQPAPHHHARYLAAVRSLGLTPGQQQQIDGFARARKAADAGADPATRRANAKKFRHDVAGVLTPDQRAQLHTALHPGAAAPAQQ